MAIKVGFPFKLKRVMCVVCQDDGNACEFCPNVDAVPDRKKEEK
jgi:hypothetical protein